MKLMLFNSPPKSGKDTAAKHLYANYDVTFERFSMPNKTAFAGCMGIGYNEFFEVDYYEDHKEEVIEGLGVSFRQWQIDFAEYYMKPKYGKDVFAKFFLKRLEGYEKNCHLGNDNIVVVPDLGFQIEVDTLEKIFDPKDVLIVQTLRDGCNYDNDSRENVTSKEFNILTITNNDLEVDYKVRIETIYNIFDDEGGSAFNGSKSFF